MTYIAYGTAPTPRPWLQILIEAKHRFNPPPTVWCTVPMAFMRAPLMIEEPRGASLNLLPNQGVAKARTIEALRRVAQECTGKKSQSKA
jgi:hypothetical protein